MLRKIYNQSCIKVTVIKFSLSVKLLHAQLEPD